MGRLTLNPIAHIDPIGTILIAGAVDYFQRPILIWLCEARSGQFQQFEESEAGYGLGRVGRAGNESCVGGELYARF